MAEFKEVIRQRCRMCYSHCGCSSCALNSKNNGKRKPCDNFMLGFPEEAEKIIMDWSEKHPEKTMLQDFIEKFPNVHLEHGAPRFCPHLIYGNKTCNRECMEQILGEDWGHLVDCWNRPIPESEADE